MVTQNDIWRLLEEVKDPEIPVISIVELGMVNDVAINNNKIERFGTPKEMENSNNVTIKDFSKTNE